MLSGSIFGYEICATITPSDASEAVYYTTDTTDPDETDTLYSVPFEVSSGPVEVRARAYREGYAPSQIVSHQIY